ncbi:MAG: ABC transporter ATP-binding protein [Alphaproteobacteria bacterium]|nr:ABC transporter ATP-binding protein [Alphaproteobacteria bacterium]
MSLVTVDHCTRVFGGLTAVDDVSFAINAGEIRAIIGPNGAGKTTLVGLISGRITPTSGTVRFKGRDISSAPSWQRVMLGIVYTFQVTSIYRNLTCFENVALAAQRRHMGLTRRNEREVQAIVRTSLARVGLSEDAERQAGILPYGHQRLLEVAMALALEPELLILDEPTQGLAPAEIAGFCDLVRAVAESATVLLIEHNLKVVLDLAHGITVMDQGRIIAEGSPAEIEQHPAVQRAYLGA